MLILAREVGQVLMIGDVRVTLIEVRSKTKVRIGIEAPREVPVHRLEVYKAIKQKEQQQ